MYLCYKLAVLTNELFRLKMKRKGGKNKKNNLKVTSVQIDPAREYSSSTPSH